MERPDLPLKFGSRLVFDWRNGHKVALVVNGTAYVWFAGSFNEHDAIADAIGGLIKLRVEVAQAEDELRRMLEDG